MEHEKSQLMNKQTQLVTERGGASTMLRESRINGKSLSKMSSTLIKQ